MGNCLLFRARGPGIGCRIKKIQIPRICPGRGGGGGWVVTGGIEPRISNEDCD